MSPKLVTVAQMRQLESEADAAGVSYAAMMESAGQAVADAILAHVDPKHATILVLVGKGNNGGDGLVCARHLHDAEAIVKVYCLQPPDETDTKVTALRERSTFIVDAENDLQSRVLKHLVNSATVIVDAVFGTGVRLPLTGKAAQLLAQVKRILETRPRPYIVAVDVPSGIDCDSGEVDANTLTANLTVTFGAAKVGQYRFPAADYLGELIVAPIGWPDDLPTLATIQLELADRARAQAALPKRERDSHKYTYGRLLVIAGSRNYVGAAYLVGAAAIRSGAGLVTMAVPESVQAMLAPQLIEATWLPLSESITSIESALEKSDAVVLGPGLGTDGPAKNIVRTVETLHATSLQHPTSRQPHWLIDADGLRLLAQRGQWHIHIPQRSILTPHAGEMQALTGIDKDEIQKDRINIAQRFAKEWNHIVLLKGAFTVIAHPDGRTMIEPFATPALAKAGSGDVLSGIIGSLLAQGVEPFEAAVAGAFIHGRAGELAAKELGTTVSVAARDLVGQLPKVFGELEN
jgi:NAD(P)H-hydrate epimerase